MSLSDSTARPDPPASRPKEVGAGPRACPDTEDYPKEGQPQGVAPTGFVAGPNSHLDYLSGNQATGFQQAFAIFAKDLRAELRNRAALNAILLFAITALVVVGLAMGPRRMDIALKAALMWIVLFFAAFSGLAHVFIHEEETGTVTALRLSAAPGAVYAGKLLFNLLLLAVIAVVVVPLFVLMLDLRLERPLAFIGVLFSGCIGLGAAATIVAAIIAKARGKGALYGALGFPILLPLLFIAVDATRATLDAQAMPGILFRDISGLVAFAVMLITASSLLFPFVWED